MAITITTTTTTATTKINDFVDQAPK